YAREVQADRAHQLSLTRCRRAGARHVQARRPEYPHQPDGRHDAKRLVETRVTVELVRIVEGTQTLVGIVEEHRTHRGDARTDDVGEQARIVREAQCPIAEEGGEAADDDSS